MNLNAEKKIKNKSNLLKKRKKTTYQKNNQNHYYDWPFRDYLQDHPVSYRA